MDSDNTPTTREYEIENGEIQTTLEAASDLLTHLLPQDWSHVLLIIGPDSGSDLHNQRQVFGGIQATNKLDKKAIANMLLEFFKRITAEAKENSSK